MIRNRTVNPSDRFSNPLWGGGLVLVVLGVLHLPLPLLDGSDWEGAVSWRKPILFGVSTGLTLCSLGWIFDSLARQARNRLDHLFAWVTSISLVLEVALITIQQWRGVASHFNQATRVDAFVDQAMLVLIVIAVVGIGYFLIRTFGKLELEDDFAWAARLGMVFLVISCVIGFAISAWGYQRIANGLAPETVGSKGVTKFPHGIAIHALQLLPFAVWIARRLKIPIPVSTTIVSGFSLSFALQIIFACYQTVNGFGRFELNTTTGVIIASMSLVCAAAPLAIAVASVASKTPDEKFDCKASQSKGY